MARTKTCRCLAADKVRGDVMARLSDLLLAAMAMQFILDGINQGLLR
jgi:small neutral amino acid transporter SnatA (MarC family)